MYYYQLRIRNGPDTADALVVTSVPSGTNPYISAPPSGDGQGFDPRTGATEVGAYQVTVADNGGAANAITGFLSDGNGRYDKLGRRAYLAYGTDGTTFPNLLVAGYVTGIAYPSAAEARVSVGEAQRAERTKMAFAVANATFPATTMLGGGPIRWPSGVVVTPINLPNRGPWTMKVAINDTVNGIVDLTFVSGWVLKDADATDFSYVSDGNFPRYTWSRINTLTTTEVPGGTRTVAWPPPYNPGSVSVTRIGNVYADVYSAGALVGTFPVYGGGPGFTVTVTGDFAIPWVTGSAVNTEVQVFLYTLTISENSPLHLLMHPVDIVTGLIGDAGETYDATTAASVRASIGADVRVFLRLTQSETVDAAITRMMGLFGFGRRVNAANAWEFFDVRTKTTAAPSVTVTLDDLRELPPDVWTLADSTIVNNITVIAERFAIWAPGQSSARPPDGLVPVEQKRTARFQLADGTYPETTQGVKEMTYSLPGTILNVNGTEVNLTDFTAALASTAFDRWGYGAPSSTFVCRSTITAAVGDEVLVNVNYLPNASVRGGQRIVQVLRKTNEPGGPVLVCEDAGTSAQPSLAPTFSIAASTGNARAQAVITLTNAAALAAAGVVSVLVEWAVSALSPTIAGQDLGSIIPVAPLALTTPQVAAGAKVWARAKSIQPGKRSGTFTAWAGVTLTAVGAPGSLTFTSDATDGSKGTLAWTAGANSTTYSVLVLNRPSALSATADQVVATLLAGSTGAPLAGLTPGVSYTATVKYIDAQTGTVAATATLTYTAGATVVTLTAPASANGIVGSTDASGVVVIDGTYGLDVTATVLPGVVEFWEAVETSTASGVYGTAVLVRALPSVNGSATQYRAVAPNDRLRRQLTARHVAGAAASVYTYPVELDPWGPPLARLVEAELYNLKQADTDTTTTWTFSRSASVAEVWAAYRVVTAPETTADWDALAASVTPLAAAATTYTVPRPADGQVTIARLEPRRADLSVGVSRVLTVTATPQVPHVELDDLETSTVGTQWWKVTERGIAVSGVAVQVQVGTSPVSAWVAPTRVAGAASVVRGGVLAAGEYEHDVLLDPTRQSWVMPRLTLSNGAAPIILGPFGFDRDKNPNLGTVTASGTVVSVVGDVDTKSVLLASTTRAWSATADGTFGAFDIALADAAGNAGLGAGLLDTFTASAKSDPVAYLGAGTLVDSRSVVFGNAAAAPAATWLTVTGTAPALVSNVMTMRLQASAAPASWTVRVWTGESTTTTNPATSTNSTASLTPALSAPPTVATTYSFTAANERSTQGAGSSQVTFRFKAELLDAALVVKDTRTVTVTWYVGGGAV